MNTPKALERYCPQEHPRRMGAIECVERKHAGTGSNCKPYNNERVAGELLVPGCTKRTKLRGPAKGKPVYLRQDNRLRALVKAACAGQHYALVVTAQGKAE